MAQVNLFNGNDGMISIPEKEFKIVKEFRKDRKTGETVETGKVFMVAKVANKISELNPDTCPVMTLDNNVVGRASGFTVKIPVFTPELFEQKANAQINQSKRRAKAEVMKMKNVADIVAFINDETVVKGWKYSQLSDEHQLAIRAQVAKMDERGRKIDHGTMLRMSLEAAELVGNITLVILLKDELATYEKRVAAMAKAQEARKTKLIKAS